MAITKAQKQEILNELGSIVTTAPSVTFVQFDKMPVEDTTAMRTQLREQGVGYKVIKKTLLRRALETAGILGELPALDGNIAVAYSDEDPTASAREVHTFRGKDYVERLNIVGGIFEGRFQSREEMQEIATIPSLHTLRGMFVNVINSPIQGMAVVLGQLAEKRANA